MVRLLSKPMAKNPCANRKSGTPKPGSSYNKENSTQKTEDATSEELPESINLNTASSEDLQLLPLIGPALAEKSLRSDHISP